MKRMKQKGFTLIELLAVIVILAVIALIATPIIMNVIDDAKAGAAKDSAYGYIKAVELELSNQLLKNNEKLNHSYIIEDGNLNYYNKTTSKIETMTIPYKGTKPEGTLVVKENGLYSADFVIDGYSFGYFNHKLTEKEKGNLFPTMKWQSNIFGAYNGQDTNIMKDGSVTLTYTGKDSPTLSIAYTQTYGAKSTEFADPEKLYKFAILAEPNTTYQFMADTDLANHSNFWLYAFERGEDFSVIRNIPVVNKNTIEFTTGPNTKYLAFRVEISECTVGNSIKFSNFRVFKK